MLQVIRKSKKNTFKHQLPLHIMMLPGIILGTIFIVTPMIGIVMAFQNYSVVRGFFGSQFVGFFHYKTLSTRPDFWQATWNTIIIAGLKIIFITILSIVISLLINEIRKNAFKKTVQTIIFLPYFLSWALLGGIVVEMFSLNGSFNYLLSAFGAEPVYWIVSNSYFRTIVVATDVWKTIGYQVVIFLAAIVNIDPTLYEAARVDGANYTRQCWHITLPGIRSMIVLICILNIGNIMNAGFEQILVMYSPSVYDTGDILDTMAYRIGIAENSGNGYSIGTAIGLFKSVISCILFSLSYIIARVTKGYRIF